MQALSRATATDAAAQALLRSGDSTERDGDVKECLWDTALFLSTELTPVRLTPEVEKVLHSVPPLLMRNSQTPGTPFT